MPIKNTTGSRRIPDIYIREQDVENITETTDNEPVTIMEWTPELGRLTLNDAEQYMPLLSVENRANSVVFVGSAPNMWKQLQNLARSMVGGPWHMDGVDNTLTIHNSKANRLVVAEYTYAGGEGELLSFDVTTKYMTSTVDAERASDIDPETGEIDSTMVQGVYDDTAMHSKGQLRWWDHRYSPPEILQDKTRYARLDPEVLFNFRGKVTEQSFAPDERGIPQLPSYKSTQEAQQAESENFTITEEVVRQYYQSQLNKFNEIASATISPGDDPEKAIQHVKNLFNAGNTLDDFVAKKKVWIMEGVNPAAYAWDVNNPQPGKLTVYTAPHAQESFWKTGYRHLQNAPNIVVIGEGHAVGSIVPIYREHEVEINIESPRILSSPYMLGIDVEMANDVILSTQNRIKSNAVIIGNPSIENSQNIQINNVSERYTGTWYSKKAVHKLDQGGYTTDIEFIQKTVPVSKSVISSKINTQKIYGDINKVAIESLETGAWLAPTLIEAEVKQWREDNRKDLENYSITVKQGTDPNTAEILTDKVDFSGATITAPRNIRVDE